jgi:hypothetical protein
MEYKITIKNQFIALRMLIYNSIGFIGVAYYFYYQLGPNFNVELGVVIYYLILTIPAIYIHIQYYLVNKNDAVTFDMLQKTIRVNKGSLIPFKEIKKIIIFMSFVKFRRGFVKYLPSDNYQYAKFEFEDGKQYTLTSLMVPELEDFINTLEGVYVERKRRFIPNII